MKKISMYILVFLLSLVVFIFGFQDKNSIEPNYLYQVYLDDEVLGVIESKDELEEYIDKECASIKEQYKVVTCSKCDFEEMTIVSTTRISCCAVD